MNNCNNNDKILSYIENELNESDKKQFEIDLENDSTLKKEYNEINGLIKSLNKLPKVNTSSNFMVSLNKKIDDYENNKSSIFKFKKIFANNSIPKLSMATMGIVLIFTLTFFIPNLDTNVMLSKSSEINSMDDVADSDSLMIDDSAISDD